MKCAETLLMWLHADGLHFYQHPFGIASPIKDFRKEAVKPRNSPSTVSKVCSGDWCMSSAEFSVACMLLAFCVTSCRKRCSVKLSSMPSVHALQATIMKSQQLPQLPLPMLPIPGAPQQQAQLAALQAQRPAGIDAPSASHIALPQVPPAIERQHAPLTLLPQEQPCHLPAVATPAMTGKGQGLLTTATNPFAVIGQRPAQTSPPQQQQLPRQGTWARVAASGGNGDPNLMQHQQPGLLMPPPPPQSGGADFSGKVSQATTWPCLQAMLCCHRQRSFGQPAPDKSCCCLPSRAHTGRVQPPGTAAPPANAAAVPRRADGRPCDLTGGRPHPRASGQPGQPPRHSAVSPEIDEQLLHVCSGSTVCAPTMDGNLVWLPEASSDISVV